MLLFRLTSFSTSAPPLWLQSSLQSRVTMPGGKNSPSPARNVMSNNGLQPVGLKRSKAAAAMYKSHQKPKKKKNYETY